MLFNCRQLTDSATGKDASGSFTDRLLRSISDVKRAKMSMQNQWKFLSQLKDYLNKTSYDKNQQIGLPRDWLDTLQKLTYSQLETIRKLSSTDSSKIIDTGKDLSTKRRDDNDSKNHVRSPLMPEQANSLITDSATITQTKVQQVII